MIGAIIGDIVGSRFEWNNYRAKDFELFTPECFVTDDSIMTISIGKAIVESKDFNELNDNAVKYMRKIGGQYPRCGYGARFYWWMYDEKDGPYNSFGNGAAMRISGAGIAGKTLEEVKIISKKVTEVTHNHEEGIKGAEATAVCIYLAKIGKDIHEIKDYIHNYYYPMNFTLDEIRDTYEFNETCQDTVPQALKAFFESVSFEDAIRNAISIGGDSDTLAAITGSVAEAYYGVPLEIREMALSYLDEQLLALLLEFEEKYPLK